MPILTTPCEWDAAAWSIVAIAERACEFRENVQKAADACCISPIAHFDSFDSHPLTRAGVLAGGMEMAFRLRTQEAVELAYVPVL